MEIPVPKKYIADYEKFGLGMFVHWGMSAQFGKDSWVYYRSGLTMEEYKKTMETFTAEDFDADEIVLTAKNAGCNYIIFVTRHHDGFSLYDTCGLNDFDAPHSAAKRDLVREFVDACNKHNIVPFLYHTTWDWYNTDFDNDFDAYLEYLNKSVEILCKNYGKIGGFWFDGNWKKPFIDPVDGWKVDKLYGMIRKYQPDAMIINNTGLNAQGQIIHEEIDAVTFEQEPPKAMDRRGMDKYVAIEMCETTNDGWGIMNFDFNYKSPKEIIGSLCLSRKVGANYVLNIGPTGSGKIPSMQKELFKLLGEWMNFYGEAIYKGKPHPGSSNGKQFILKGDKELYIFFFDLARLGSENFVVRGRYCGGFCFGNVEEKIKSIEWMDTHEEIEFIQKNKLLIVNATGYPLGYSTCVRVARAKIEE